ncbi:hypothetical protein BS78_09G242400 [Paspalum vaginatum]|nr:hypothetical protein BS78_09G242400 [Paspalum vaginatum]
MRGEAEVKPPPALSLSPSPWDCGSPLYDTLELASVYRVLDAHLMALRPSRPSPAREPATDADDGDGGVAVLTERAAVAVAVAKAKGRGRRRRAATVAKAARRTGAAVLHSICRSVACGRRL